MTRKLRNKENKIVILIMIFERIYNAIFECHKALTISLLPWQTKPVLLVIAPRHDTLNIAH